MLCHPELRKEIHLDKEERLSLIELENTISIIWRLAATTAQITATEKCVAMLSLMGKHSDHFL